MDLTRRHVLRATAGVGAAALGAALAPAANALPVTVAYPKIISTAGRYCYGGQPYRLDWIDPQMCVTAYRGSIKNIQRRLGQTQDGIIGVRTRAAILAFQRSHGLVVDGVVGARTAARMGMRWTDLTP